jgi:hypothetical protein
VPSFHSSAVMGLRLSSAVSLPLAAPAALGRVVPDVRGGWCTLTTEEEDFNFADLASASRAEKESEDGQTVDALALHADEGRRRRR